MKTICQPLGFGPAFLPESLGPTGSLLFFDIETTGFSGDRDMVYLIGGICRDESSHTWQLLQWFADRKDEEKDILAAFFSRINAETILIHYNGDSFDIPFLLRRAGRLGLPSCLKTARSIDIYKKIRPYKRIFGSDSLKQKSVETFLGIKRQDRYSGGQLVPVYFQYLESQSQALSRMLALHNEEDVKGLLKILPILSYPALFEQDCPFFGQSIQKDILFLHYQSPCRIPVPIQIAKEDTGILLQAEDTKVTCRIPMYRGELKYFYPNYKDYYYLPLEDTAVHKSVGSYVAKEARVKATAKTCYTRKKGLFLPQPDSLWQPAFRKDYRSYPDYALYAETLFSGQGTANRYLRWIMSGCQ